MTIFLVRHSDIHLCFFTAHITVCDNVFVTESYMVCSVHCKFHTSFVHHFTHLAWKVVHSKYLLTFCWMNEQINGKTYGGRMSFSPG